MIPRTLRPAPFVVSAMLCVTTLLPTGSSPARMAWAAGLPVSLVHLSSPVTRSSEAAVQVKTAPGAACAITVRYKSGPSRARGLEPKVADRSGLVEWRWLVGSNTTPGQWPVVVTCELGGDRGELRTTLEVR